MITSTRVAERAIYFIDRLNELVRNLMDQVDADSRHKRSKDIDDEIHMVLKYYSDKTPPLDILIFKVYKRVHERLIGEFPDEPDDPRFHRVGPYVDVKAITGNISGQEGELRRFLWRYVIKCAREHTDQKPTSAPYQIPASLPTNGATETIQKEIEELFAWSQIPAHEVSVTVEYPPLTIPLPKNLDWWTVTKDVADVGRYLGGINLRVVEVAKGIGALKLSPRPSWLDDNDAPRPTNERLVQDALLSAYATIAEWVEEISASKDVVIPLVDWLTNRVEGDGSGGHGGRRHVARERVEHWCRIGVEHIILAEVENPPRPPKKSVKQPNGESGLAGTSDNQTTEEKAVWLSKGGKSRAAAVKGRLGSTRAAAVILAIHQDAPEVVREHLRALKTCAAELTGEADKSADEFKILSLEAQWRLVALLGVVELKVCKDAAGWMALVVHLALFDGRMVFDAELNPTYRWMLRIKRFLKKQHERDRKWLDPLLKLAAHDPDS